MAPFSPRQGWADTLPQGAERGGIFSRPPCRQGVSEGLSARAEKGKIQRETLVLFQFPVSFLSGRLLSQPKGGHLPPSLPPPWEPAWRAHTLRGQ